VRTLQVQITYKYDVLCTHTPFPSISLGVFFAGMCIQ